MSVQNCMCQPSERLCHADVLSRQQFVRDCQRIVDQLTDVISSPSDLLAVDLVYRVVNLLQLITVRDDFITRNDVLSRRGGVSNHARTG